MAETFGEFIDVAPPSGAEYLSLSFSPSSVPLKQRWRNNGLSADFLGDYVTTFYPKDGSDPGTETRQAEISGAVTYIANELLENAMKYTDDREGVPIAISLFLHADRLVFLASNAVDPAGRATFEGHIREILAGDPGELFMARLEAQAMSENSAGLGYLTMINDYGARLAWRFDDGTPAVATTQVVLEI